MSIIEQLKNVILSHEFGTRSRENYYKDTLYFSSLIKKATFAGIKTHDKLEYLLQVLTEQSEFVTLVSRIKSNFYTRIVVILLFVFVSRVIIPFNNDQYYDVWFLTLSLAILMFWLITVALLPVQSWVVLSASNLSLEFKNWLEVYILEKTNSFISYQRKGLNKKLLIRNMAKHEVQINHLAQTAKLKKIEDLLPIAEFFCLSLATTLALGSRFIAIFSS